MPRFFNGIQADEFTREMKSQNLLATVLAGGIGFNGTGFHDIEALKLIAFPKKVIAAMQRPIPFDDLVESVHVIGIEPHG